MYIEINKRTIVPILAALGLLGACIAKVATDGTWEKDLESLAIALFGTLTFLFTDTVVELLEDDKPHAEWFQTPNTWVKVGGGVSLLICTLLIFDVL